MVLYLTLKFDQIRKEMQESIAAASLHCFCREIYPELIVITQRNQDDSFDDFAALQVILSNNTVFSYLYFFYGRRPSFTSCMKVAIQRY